jgi:hypothetical protein
MAAAVADYSPAGGAVNSKIEKGGPLTITLERTPDILAELGTRRQGSRPVLVGFAAQTGDPVPAAGRKLAAKQVDLIVANDVTAPGAGFDTDTNIVTLVDAADRSGYRSCPNTTWPPRSSIALKPCFMRTAHPPLPRLRRRQAHDRSPRRCRTSEILR